MLDPVIAKENKKTMSKEELEQYYDRCCSETSTYVYGEKQGMHTESKDFMFDAMSLISWRNVLSIIDVEVTPFIPIAVFESTVHEKKNLKAAGKLARDIMDRLRKDAGRSAFVRTDVNCSHRLIHQIHQGNWYPGLERGLVRQDKIIVDDEIRAAQWFSPNPKYIFMVQHLYHEAYFHSYRVIAGKVEGPEEHKSFVEAIVKKLTDLNIRPRHPQYNEHGTEDVSFMMTTTTNPETGQIEVFTATAADIQDGRAIQPLVK